MRLTPADLTKAFLCVTLRVRACAFAESENHHGQKGYRYQIRGSDH
jgi:hypothetical protein